MPETGVAPATAAFSRVPVPPPLAGDRHARAVANTLRMADQAASEADFGAALSWLAVIEAIGDDLPSDYHTKRAKWSSRLTQRADVRRTLLAVLETARQSIGAHYGALLVIDPRRQRIDHRLTAGLEPRHGRADGVPDLRGRLLGQLLIDPEAPIRLVDAADHPARYGFPTGHPPMRNFLGVSVVIDGGAAGNLCLGEKEHGRFTRADEQALRGLALTVAATVTLGR